MRSVQDVREARARVILEARTAGFTVVALCSFGALSAIFPGVNWVCSIVVGGLLVAGVAVGACMAVAEVRARRRLRARLRESMRNPFAGSLVDAAVGPPSAGDAGPADATAVVQPEAWASESCASESAA